MDLLYARWQMGLSLAFPQREPGHRGQEAGGRKAFERKGRHYVTFEFIATDEKGKVLIRKLDTLLQMPQAVREAD